MVLLAGIVARIVARIKVQMLWIAWLNFTGRTMSQELGYGWIGNVHPKNRDRTLAPWHAPLPAWELWAGISLMSAVTENSGAERGFRASK